MLALYTVHVVVHVDDEEAASRLAVEMDKTTELNIESVLERNGATREDIEAGMANLGVSVAIIPETVLA